MFANVAGRILGSVALIEWLISVCNPKSSVPIGMVGILVNFIKFSKRVEVKEFLIKEGEGFPFEEKKRFVYNGGFNEFHLFILASSVPC